MFTTIAVQVKLPIPALPETAFTNKDAKRKKQLLKKRKKKRKEEEKGVTQERRPYCGWKGGQGEPTEKWTGS